jgi:peptidoglycan/xylan/chitin deacetylase (PgdA/CDA1 family)
MTLLNLLQSRNVFATFFVSSLDIRTRRSLITEIARAGHDFGILGLAGPHWTSEVIDDITECKKAVAEIIKPFSNAPIIWYRPQDGSRDASVLRAANRIGLTVAFWSATPYDWDAHVDDIGPRLERQCGTKGPSGHIVALTLAVPKYLQAPAQARKPQHSSAGVTAEVLAFLKTWDTSACTLAELFGVSQ